MNDLAVEECSLFAEGLESGTIMSSLQVQGSISVDGVGDLVRINGVLNAEKYRQLLYLSTMQNPQGFCRTMTPKHTSKIIIYYLQIEE